MKLLCTQIDVTCAADDVVRVHAKFIIPIVGGRENPSDLGKMVGKTVELLADSKVEIVKASDDGQARCFYCAQLNLSGALECVKCGGRIED